MNSTECDYVYHRFSKIPSLVRIINSQMICAEDLDREQFCYVSTSPPHSLTSKGTWPEVGLRAQGRRDLKEWGGEGGRGG